MAKEQNQQFIEERLRFLRTLSNEELQRIAAGGSAAPQPTQVPVQQQVQAPVQPVQQPQQFAQAPQQVQQPIAAPVQQQVAQPSQQQRLAELDQLSDEELARIAGISPDELQARKRQKTLGQIPFANPFLSAVGQAVVEPAIEGAEFLTEAGRTGLGQLGTGIIQRGAELGGDATGAIARTVLPLVRPDLSEELGQLTSEDVRRSAQETGLGLKKEAQERGGAFEATSEIFRAAPALAIGPGRLASGVLRVPQLIAQGAGAFGLTEFLDPTEGETREQSLDNAINNTLSAFETGGEVGGALGVTSLAVPPALRSIANVALKTKTNIKNAVGDRVRKFARINQPAAKELLDAELLATVAQVSDSPTVQFLDRFLDQSPGSSAVLRNSMEKVTETATKIADGIGLKKAQSPQQAGGIIRKASDRFISDFSAETQTLYKRLNKFIRPTEKFETGNTLKLVDDIAKQNVRTPGKFRIIKETPSYKTLIDFSKDSALQGPKGMAYKDIKDYRTLFGQTIGSAEKGTTNRAIADRMYESLSKDMSVAAKSKGKEAFDTWKRADSFFSKGTKELEELKKSLKRNVDESLFNAAVSGTKLGSTKLENITRGLNKQESDIVLGTFLKKLGGGEDFNLPRMLTRWNGLSSESKKILLPNSGRTKDAARSMKLLQDFSEGMKDLNRFSNASRTSPHNQLAAILIGVFTKPTTTALAVLTGNRGAKLLTNQDFAKWLAGLTTTKIATPGKAINYVKRLSKIAEDNQDIAGEIAQFSAIANTAFDSNPAVRDRLSQ